MGDYVKTILDTAPAKRSYQDVEFLFQVLYENKYFRERSVTSAVEICKIVGMRIVQNNEIVYRDGDCSDGFYIIFAGTVSIQLQWNDHSAVRILTVGDSFGESLAENQTRTGTAIAIGICELLFVPRKEYVYLLSKTVKMDSEGVQSIATWLLGVDLLRHASLSDLEKVAKRLSKERHSRGEYITQQGETAECLYFIVSGDVILYREDSDQDDDNVIKSPINDNHEHEHDHEHDQECYEEDEDDSSVTLSQQHDTTNSSNNNSNNNWDVTRQVKAKTSVQQRRISKLQPPMPPHDRLLLSRDAKVTCLGLLQTGEIIGEELTAFDPSKSHHWSYSAIAQSHDVITMKIPVDKFCRYLDEQGLYFFRKRAVARYHYRMNKMPPASVFQRHVDPDMVVLKQQQEMAHRMAEKIQQKVAQYPGARRKQYSKRLQHVWKRISLGQALSSKPSDPKIVPTVVPNHPPDAQIPTMTDSVVPKIAFDAPVEMVQGKAMKKKQASAERSSTNSATLILGPHLFSKTPDLPPKAAASINNTSTNISTTKPNVPNARPTSAYLNNSNPSPLVGSFWFRKRPISAPSMNKNALEDRKEFMQKIEGFEEKNDIDDDSDGDDDDIGEDDDDDVDDVDSDGDEYDEESNEDINGHDTENVGNKRVLEDTADIGNANNIINSNSNSNSVNNKSRPQSGRTRAESTSMSRSNSRSTHRNVDVNIPMVGLRDDNDNDDDDDDDDGPRKLSSRQTYYPSRREAVNYDDNDDNGKGRGNMKSRGATSESAGSKTTSRRTSFAEHNNNNNNDNDDDDDDDDDDYNKDIASRRGSGVVVSVSVRSHSSSKKNNDDDGDNNNNNNGEVMSPSDWRNVIDNPHLVTKLEEAKIYGKLKSNTTDTTNDADDADENAEDQEEQPIDEKKEDTPPPIKAVVAISAMRATEYKGGVSMKFMLDDIFGKLDVGKEGRRVKFPSSSSSLALTSQESPPLPPPLKIISSKRSDSVWRDLAKYEGDYDYDKAEEYLKQTDEMMRRELGLEPLAVTESAAKAKMRKSMVQRASMRNTPTATPKTPGRDANVSLSVSVANTPGSESMRTPTATPVTPRLRRKSPRRLRKRTTSMASVFDVGTPSSWSRTPTAANNKIDDNNNNSIDDSRLLLLVDDDNRGRVGSPLVLEDKTSNDDAAAAAAKKVSTDQVVVDDDGVSKNNAAETKKAKKKKAKKKKEIVASIPRVSNKPEGKSKGEAAVVKKKKDAVDDMDKETKAMLDNIWSAKKPTPRYHSSSSNNNNNNNNNLKEMEQQTHSSVDPKILEEQEKERKQLLRRVALLSIIEGPSATNDMITTMREFPRIETGDGTRQQTLLESVQDSNVSNGIEAAFAPPPPLPTRPKTASASTRSCSEYNNKHNSHRTLLVSPRHRLLHEQQQMQQSNRPDVTLVLEKQLLGSGFVDGARRAYPNRTSVHNVEDAHRLTKRKQVNVWSYQPAKPKVLNPTTVGAAFE